jgi:hypothetical protein
VNIKLLGIRSFKYRKEKNFDAGEPVRYRNKKAQSGSGLKKPDARKKCRVSQRKLHNYITVVVTPKL